MKVQGDYIIFSTGSTRYANNGIIGIAPDMNVTGGYDAGFYNEEGEDDILSKVELLELADYMIEQWQKFKKLHEGADK